jgi:hypothetical protein
MSFTLSGSVITQSNETAKTITAVAAATGGIRVTVSAHGYNIGDAIEIAGTTSYNGFWIISNVTSLDTFDIVGQSFDPEGTLPLAFVSTQTGTAARGDANLNGLAAIAGVTTWDTSGTMRLLNYVFSTTLSLTVSGSLRIPRGQCLVVPGSFATSGRVRISGGGRLRIDKRMNRFGGVSYQAQDAILFTGSTGTGGSPWATLPTCFLYLNVGRFEQYGGRVVVPGGVRFQDTCTYQFRNAVWDGDLNVLTDDDVPVWYVTAGLNRFDVIGWDMVRGKFEFAAADVNPVNLSGIRIIASNRAFSTGATLPDASWFPLRGVTTIDSKCGVSLHTRKRIRVYNSDRITVVLNDATGGTGGLVEQRHVARFKLTDAAGTAQPGGKIWATDTNSGTRRNWTETLPNEDYTTTRTYTGTADSSGFASLDFLVFVNQIIGPNTGTQWFTDNRFSSDTINLRAISYKCAITYASHRTNVGNVNGANYEYVVASVDDINITEPTKSVVDAYTTIPTAAKFYDRAKSWLCDNYAGQTQTLVALEGSAIVTQSNVTIDAGAAAAFAYNSATNTITIKATEFDGSIYSSGTVSLLSGATVTGRIIDAYVDSYGEFLMPSDYDTCSLHASAADADANLNPVLVGDKVRYSSTVFGGNTVWIRLTSSTLVGAEIITSVQIPTLAGSYVFTAAQFGENAQLSRITWAVDELRLIHGLVSGEPVTVTPVSRIAGNVSQTISGDGVNETIISRAS